MSSEAIRIESERILQEVSAGLRGKPPGDLAHRGEQRKATARILDRLVRDRSRT